MNMATASGRNLFLDNFAREVFPSFNLSPLHSLIEKFISELVLKEVKKKNKEYMVEVRAYLDKQGSFNMLSYLQTLVILEVKTMKSSTVYADTVTFIDCIDCFGFILKNWYKCLFVFALSAVFLLKRKIMTVGFLNYNYQIRLHHILRRTENHLSMDWALTKKRFGCMYECFKWFQNELLCVLIISKALPKIKIWMPHHFPYIRF